VSANGRGRCNTGEDECKSNATERKKKGRGGDGNANYATSAKGSLAMGGTASSSKKKKNLSPLVQIRIKREYRAHPIGGSPEIGGATLPKHRSLERRKLWQRIQSTRWREERPEKKCFREGGSAKWGGATKREIRLLEIPGEEKE